MLNKWSKNAVVIYSSGVHSLDDTESFILQDRVHLALKH